jgi:hypothetical protein
MDPKARTTTIPFNGGSITATRGLLEAIFGEELVADASENERTVERQSHTRTRVIGQGSTMVAGSSYSITSYGKRAGGTAAGGEDIQVIVDGDPWTMRLTGSHQAFNNLLKQGGFAGGKVVMWYSAKGTAYGPYKSAQDNTTIA